ncbi:MAG: hypothetical protein HZB19_02980 [Chloroflexi bacterium]|nr:hypothetical protein [Chloroflexota bacterium]
MELERLFPGLTRTLRLVPLRLGDRILGLFMLAELFAELEEACLQLSRTAILDTRYINRRARRQRRSLN